MQSGQVLTAGKLVKKAKQGRKKTLAFPHRAADDARQKIVAKADQSESKRTPALTRNLHQKIETLWLMINIAAQTAIENFLVRFSAPIGWLPSLDASSDKLKCKTGTCALINTGKVKVFVTCEHVWAGWRKYKSKHPAAVLLVGLDNGVPFNLTEAKLLASDPNCDLAVVEAEIDQQQMRAKSFFQIEEWPIQSPNVGDFMTIIGFSGRGRITSKDCTAHWNTTHLGFQVSAVNPRDITLAPEKNDRKSYDRSGNEIPHANIGGMSGSPAFLLKREGMPLLAGFLRAGNTSDNFVFLTPARYLQPNGKLCAWT